MKNRIVCFIFIICLLLSISACEFKNEENYNGDDEDYYEEEYDEEEYDEEEDYNDSIPWDEANEHIGEYATVSGPVVGTKYASDSGGQPTFLDIGENYPSQSRVTVIIWGDNRSAFSDAPEDMYYLHEIKVSGYIDTYNGIVQIEAYSEDDIEIVG